MPFGQVMSSVNHAMKENPRTKSTFLDGLPSKYMIYIYLLGLEGLQYIGIFESVVTKVTNRIWTDHLIVSAEDGNCHLGCGRTQKIWIRLPALTVI